MNKLNNLFSYIIGSKVRYGVKICNSHVESLIAFHRSVSYGINISTCRPTNCGPLAVFKSKRKAFYFICKQAALVNSIRFFKCKYIKSKDKLLWELEHNICKTSLPNGTRFADIVILKKEISLYR